MTTLTILPDYDFTEDDACFSDLAFTDDIDKAMAMAQNQKKSKITGVARTVGKTGVSVAVGTGTALHAVGKTGVNVAGKTARMLGSMIRDSMIRDSLISDAMMDISERSALTECDPATGKDVSASDNKLLGDATTDVSDSDSSELFDIEETTCLNETKDSAEALGTPNSKYIEEEEDQSTKSDPRKGSTEKPSCRRACGRRLQSKPKPSRVKSLSPTPSSSQSDDCSPEKRVVSSRVKSLSPTPSSLRSDGCSPESDAPPPEKRVVSRSSSGRRLRRSSGDRGDDQAMDTVLSQEVPKMRRTRKSDGCLNLLNDDSDENAEMKRLPRQNFDYNRQKRDGKRKSHQSNKNKDEEIPRKSLSSRIRKQGAYPNTPRTKLERARTLGDMQNRNTPTSTTKGSSNAGWMEISIPEPPSPMRRTKSLQINPEQKINQLQVKEKWSSELKGLQGNRLKRGNSFDQAPCGISRTSSDTIKRTNESLGCTSSQAVSPSKEAHSIEALAASLGALLGVVDNLNKEVLALRQEVRELRSERERN